ncbi:Hypothetical protein, putative [Bodo saltans]|uniref:Uncharacterized protein n=1 Tax=Bodo saltans TaxID=75058 RepID=A0A0S4IRM9_BODSA|nr:Hypothetical protein, putative [Bodo saltans]|eukprot:CUF51384.1 Hypothetical protein, putative [Bodo saltans]
MYDRRKSRARRRHTDSSDDDDDPLYDTFVDDNGATRSKPLPTSEFPKYTKGLTSIAKPEPLPEIHPDKFRQAQKEMLSMLSGMFSWELFMNGKKKAKCEFQPEFVEAAKVRKRESSWKQSVTRRAALSIHEAVENKDLILTYNNLMKRQDVMDSEREKAHLMRMYPQLKLPDVYGHQQERRAAAGSRSKSAMDNNVTTHFAADGATRGGQPPRAASSMSTAAAAQQRTITTSPARGGEELLLLNDDMLLQEATHLVMQAARGTIPASQALAAHVTLRHRSLTPLKETLQTL